MTWFNRRCNFIGLGPPFPGAAIPSICYFRITNNNNHPSYSIQLLFNQRPIWLVIVSSTQLLVNKDFFRTEYHKHYEYNDGRWEWRPVGMAAPGNGGLIPLHQCQEMWDRL